MTIDLVQIWTRSDQESEWSVIYVRQYLQVYTICFQEFHHTRLDMISSRLILALQNTHAICIRNWDIKQWFYKRFSEMNFQIIFVIVLVLLNQVITRNDKLLDARRNLKIVITKYNILTPWEIKLLQILYDRRQKCGNSYLNC